MPIPPELTTQLNTHQQSQLLRFWSDLSEAEQQQLTAQIESIDFSGLRQMIDQAFHAREHKSTAASIQLAPLENAIRLPQSPAEAERWQQATLRGHELLNAGQVGCILVAGGQGSRLGFAHPKGMFPIGPVTDRSLFQIFFEQLLALSNRHGVRIPYFIMTSDATHAETVAFLEEHAWFGYPAEDVFLFRQGTLPAVDDQTGQILLADKAEIAMSPDGHGGLLNALLKAGCLAEMQRRGIEYLYYHQVDNPCARLCDPKMLGFHVEQQAEISTKVVAKRNAAEKVGVLAQIDGKQGIIEYSDLPAELAEQQDEQGRLSYWAGNIAIHVLSRTLLERLTDADSGLPIHIAHKKVACLDEQGTLVEPEAPNAFKFERFIFDSIPLARAALVIETSREDEFNPVKNATGDDSPESSRTALNALGRKWLAAAGYTVDPAAQVEISPLIALEPADLTDQLTPEQLTGTEIVLQPDGETA